MGSESQVRPVIAGNGLQKSACMLLRFIPVCNTLIPEWTGDIVFCIFGQSFWSVQIFRDAAVVCTFSTWRRLFQNMLIPSLNEEPKKSTREMGQDQESVCFNVYRLQVYSL